MPTWDQMNLRSVYIIICMYSRAIGPKKVKMAVIQKLLLNTNFFHALLTYEITTLYAPMNGGGCNFATSIETWSKSRDTKQGENGHSSKSFLPIFIL